MHIVLVRNLGKVPDYETEAGLVKATKFFSLKY